MIQSFSALFTLVAKWIIEAIYTLVNWIFETSADLAKAIFTYAKQLLPTNAQDFINNIGNIWTDIPALQIVMFWLPLLELYAIFTLGIAAIVSIRTTRWLLSVLPRAITGLD